MIAGAAWDRRCGLVLEDDELAAAGPRAETRSQSSSPWLVGSQIGALLNFWATAIATQASTVRSGMLTRIRVSRYAAHGSEVAVGIPALALILTLRIRRLAVNAEQDTLGIPGDVGLFGAGLDPFQDRHQIAAERPTDRVADHAHE